MGDQHCVETIEGRRGLVDHGRIAIIHTRTQGRGLVMAPSWISAQVISPVRPNSPMVVRQSSKFSAGEQTR